MATCIVDGCNKPRAHERRYCSMHCGRLSRRGELKIGRRENGSGSINTDGYVDICINGVRTYEHIVAAARALGRPLPAGALVHHVNGNKSDNRPENLVVCPNEAYHKLIHIRMKALADCGNAGWRKCWVCGEYDDPANLRREKQPEHVDCGRAYARLRYKRNRGASGGVNAA